MQQLKITPPKAKEFGFALNQDGIHRSAFELLGYQDTRFADLQRTWPELKEIPKAIAEQLEIEAGYVGYLGRQQMDIDRFRQEEGMMIPSQVNYDAVPSLSNEIREKLKTHRPASLGEAGRIPGMTPAALMILLAYLRRPAKAA